MYILCANLKKHREHRLEHEHKRRELYRLLLWLCGPFVLLALKLRRAYFFNSAYTWCIGNSMRMSRTVGEREGEMLLGELGFPSNSSHVRRSTVCETVSSSIIIRKKWAHPKWKCFRCGGMGLLIKVRVGVDSPCDFLHTLTGVSSEIPMIPFWIGPPLDGKNRNTLTRMLSVLIFVFRLRSAPNT